MTTPTDNIKLRDLDTEKLIRYLDKKEANRLKTNSILTQGISLLPGPVIASGVAYTMSISAEGLIKNPINEMLTAQDLGVMLPSTLMLLSYGLLKHTNNYLKNSYGQNIEKAMSSTPHAYYRDALRQLNTPKANGTVVDNIKKGRSLWELSARLPNIFQTTRMDDMPNSKVSRLAPKRRDAHIPKIDFIIGFVPFSKPITDFINEHRSAPKFFDKRQKGSVTLTHLAALLGNDDSEIGRVIKSSKHIQNDPDVQRIFSNADDVLNALTSNNKGLRASLNAYFEAIGPAAQSFFRDPGNLKSCLKEWDQLLGDVYAFEMNFASKLTLRQKATETVADLNRELKQPSPSRAKLESLSKELRAFEALQQGKGLADMVKMSSLCGDLSKAIDEVLRSPDYGNRYDPLMLPNGELPGLSAQTQQLLQIDVPNQTEFNKHDLTAEWSPLDNAYRKTHKLLHREEDPYPAPGVVQEAAFNMMLGKVRISIESNLKNQALNAGIQPPTDAELKDEIDALMIGWNQRAVYALANNHNDVALREPTPEPLRQPSPSGRHPETPQNEGRRYPSRKLS